MVMLTFKEFQTKKPLSLRERFYRGLIFKIGDIVQEGTDRFEILDRGTNYVTVSNSQGDISKKFVDNLTICEDVDIPAPYDGGAVTFKGYKPGENFRRNTGAVAAFRDTISRYNSGKIVDAVAILKALKAVDKFLDIADQIEVHRNHPDDIKVDKEAIREWEIAKSSLERIGEWLHHMDYMDTLKDMIPVAQAAQETNESMNIKESDKLKVAAVIADTLGAPSTGTNAAQMVNAALRKCKTNPKSVQGESLNIIRRMLELAAEVGIDYDKSILKIEMNEAYRKGDMVSVNRPSGKTAAGRVKGMHGSVVEVSHRNGRVGFYHNHRVTPAENIIDTAPEEKAISQDLGGSAVPTLPSSPTIGDTLGASNETNRLMMVKKLKGLA